MQIIINADDYGLNANTTKAIAECFRRGIVHRTTATVNTPFFKEAIDIARRFGFIDKIGLHVNLTEGFPLTEEIRKSRFWCDTNGAFRGGIWKNKLWRFWMPKEAVRLAGIEIDAQMKAFIDSGLPLRHFDSHQYVCSYRPLNDISNQIAKTNNFVSTRVFFKRKFMGVYCRRIKSSIDKYGLKHDDALIFTHDISTKLTHFTDDAKVEIHCHPNYRNEAGDLDDEGELMDWKTGYDQSLRFLEAICG